MPAPPTALTSTVIAWPLSPSTSTTEPTPTSSVPASATISAPSSRDRSVRMRASSRPCSFFAAWYSKFSERSPNSRAVLIAATTSSRRGPSRCASSSRSASACLRGEALALYHFEPSAATTRRVDDARLRNLHAGLLELLDVALQARDARDVGLLLGQHERDADPAAPGAAGAADAVRVDVGLLRRIEVDHVRDVVDVEPARGDVGGDERLHLAGVEALERLLALRLALVAVDRCCVDVVAAQLLDQTVGAGLGAHEDEREPGLLLLQQLDERRDLVLRRDRDEAVVDVAGAAVGRQLALEAGREVRVAARELADLAVERRREEHRLAVVVQPAHELSTCGLNPMSSMRSASSSTSTST